MKGKIISILGLLIIVIAITAYFLFDLNVRRQSEALGHTVLVARDNIPEGTIIRSIEDAQKLFTAIRIQQAYEVPSALRVSILETDGNEGFFMSLINKFRNKIIPTEPTIDPKDLQQLVNKKITINLLKNQQISEIYLSNDITLFESDERLFAVPVTYVNAVGGEIAKNDYVDIWVYYNNQAPQILQGTSAKLLGPVRILKIKGENNNEIKSGSEAIPKVVLFKLDENQIKLLSEKMRFGEIFLTKWGRTPTEQDLKALENLIEDNNAVNTGTVIEPVPIEEIHEDNFEQEVNPGKK